MNAVFKTKQALSVLILLFLAGCASTPKVTQSDKDNWLDLANELKLIKTWSIEGKVGARNGEDATSFNIAWGQMGEEYSIRLFGPLGQGAIAIFGDSTQATMTQGTKSLQAENLQQLMEQNSSIQLPLNHLVYWIRGIPVPQIRAGIKVTHEGLLSELRQSDWLIEYSDYYFDQPALPKKLNISKGDMSAKIIIKSWEIN